MSKRIIYQTNEGGIAIIIPSGDLPIEQIARKDVPAGARYAIVNVSDIPLDRTFRGAWEVDQNNLNDGVGIGQQAWFIEQYQAEIDAINAELPPEVPEQIVAVSEAELNYPEEATDADRSIIYQDYLRIVAETNQQNQAKHLEEVALWEQSKVNRISSLTAQIAFQQQEMSA